MTSEERIVDLVDSPQKDEKNEEMIRDEEKEKETEKDNDEKQENDAESNKLVPN